MKQVFQLHLKGKDRVKHNFKSEAEALQHQERLVSLCRSKIANNESRARVYLREAQALEAQSVELEDTSKVFSVVEITEKGQGTIRTYFSKEAAFSACSKLQENSSRYFGVLESYIHGTC